MAEPFSRRALLAGMGAAAIAGAEARAQAAGPLVLAAASLQESMRAAAGAWERRRHARPIISFAASSALARQIAAGAAADLFVSADEAWMDHVERLGRIAPGTRADFVGNRLVLISAANNPRSLRLARNAPLAGLIGAGRLAIADPTSVPAGRYAHAALKRLGIWPRVATKIVRAENVRAALALVERGAADYGIVYATDARASARVRVAGWFPPGSHPPIRYPIARLKAATHPEAEALRRFLISAQGKAVFTRFGFAAL